MHDTDNPTGLARRYAPDVIDKLLEVVPANETQLRADLEDARSSGQYQPPESRVPWIKIQEAFSARFINETTNEHIAEHPAWERTCIDIIQGRDV